MKANLAQHIRYTASFATQVGGPNSGHYYAFVKSKEGRWFEMNDDMVQAASPPDRQEERIHAFLHAE